MKTATGFTGAVLMALLATTTAFAAARSTIDYSTYAVGPQPSAVILSIHGGMDSRGFAWQTDESVESGEVRLLEGSFGEGDDARFVRDGRLLEGRLVKAVEPGVNRHAAEVAGLKPGTTYSYRLGGGGRWVYGTFTTRPADRRDVVILNLNDPQTRLADQYFKFENTCATAARTVGGAEAIDFILQGGDFYDGRLFRAGSNTVTVAVGDRHFMQWGMAADTATPSFPGVPWVMVCGNHDVAAYPAAVNEDFKVKVKGMPGCHSFDCGNVHVVTMPWLGRSWGTAYERAFEWLEADLEAARKSGSTKWSVVAIHEGPYTTGDNMRARKGSVESGFTSNLVFRMGGICARQHVDLVLQAHDHCYSKTLPYRWDGAGFATNENDVAAVNLAPRVKTIDGKTYDTNPRGTYYVCCGCAGHRVGEVREFANRAGRMSYTNRTLKVVTGKVAVDSRHAKKGADASFDLKAQMFGVLRVAGSRLDYDFYVAEPDGTATLLDTLCICKEGTTEHAEADGAGQALDGGKARPRRAQAVDPEKNGWILKPLGSPGGLKVNTAMPNKPVFCRRRTPKDGLLLFGGGRDAVLISQHGPILQRPMNELRYHLEAMVGRAVRVQPDVPEDGTPAIVIRMCDGAPERSVVRVQGNLVCIEGSDVPGISHALTYFLESLGCRYLWPGKSGKVIPRKDRVAVPDGLALDFVPSLRIRRIRNYYAVSERRVGASDRFGLDALKVAYVRRQAGIDRPENRTFWQWHGLNDSSAVPGDEPTDAGKYRWEHRFNDYYVRYGAAHPEWFALQPDGTRVMDSRPTFCMSQEGLVKQIADDTIDLYRRDMSVVAHTLCLPDGGYKTWCQCPDCRALDPVNAPEISCLLILPQGRERRPYVSYTDRLLDFYNRIVGRIKAELPDKRFTMYAYASYEKPPVKVVPDPSLIVISVAGGDYRSAKDRTSAERTLAAWGSFGNELIWRPNVLYNYNVFAPVNYSRWLFEDLELFKANRVIGTDFDCMNGVWPDAGLNFYMLAKAHLNPDRVSYDDLLDDYCQAAFGKGAPAMKRYYLELEAQYGRIGDAWDEVVRRADPGKPMARSARADCYLRNFADAGLDKFFDEATRLAAGDEAACGRIAFVRLALDHVRMERKVAEAVWSGSPDLKRLQDEFADYVQDAFRRNPLSISPNGIGFYDPYLSATGR